MENKIEVTELGSVDALVMGGGTRSQECNSGNRETQAKLN
ncbi:hypothetical protein Cyrtocomes_00677 [Candidatus Cyrtobacter comes]|uniref:Uncharacterized protein n=1 Tax=Candidatus Cyrtobacter comes TaxID=675776 RepID=A0ABU5L859_9RICK|nr:hypothetical protein [Candidatus Cyrtobacter comes]